MATVLIELTRVDGTKIQIQTGNIKVEPHGTGSLITFLSGGAGDERANFEIVTESPSAIRTAANT